MLCESSVPQIFRHSPHFVERPQSPNVRLTAQPVPTKSVRSLNSFSDDHQNLPILAPSPKKMVYRGGSLCSDHDDVIPWGLPTLAEDSDEDSFDGDSISESLESSESSEAFAELFSIIHKPSSPRFNEDYSDYYEKERHEDKVNEDCSYDYFGRSPISRTQNPLPLDSMFHNGGTVIPKVKVYNPGFFDTSEETGNALSSAFNKATVDSHPISLSFEKLRIRPRSHSVGAKSGQLGVMF